MDTLDLKPHGVAVKSGQSRAGARTRPVLCRAETDLGRRPALALAKPQPVVRPKYIGRGVCDEAQRD